MNRVTHKQAEAWADEADECRRNAEIAIKDGMQIMAANLIARATELEVKVRRAMENA